MTLVESKFNRVTHETFDRLRRELSSDISRAEAAKAFLAFLDLGAQTILVRHHRSGDKGFEVSYFDAWYKNLSIAKRAEREKCVQSYLASAEGRLLLLHLDELRTAADEVGIQWERAEALLREILREHEEGGRTPPVSRTQRGSLRPREILGERDGNVARRRVVMRNMMRSKESLHALDVCKEWDDLGIPVLDVWRPAVSTWQ
jgi:hypothetical protein